MSGKATIQKPGEANSGQNVNTPPQTPPAQAAETPPAQGQEKEKGLVLFGKQLPSNLPPAVQQLMTKFKTREIPGVSPTWNPVKEGDTIAGVCVKYREAVGQYASNLVVLENSDGFHTVWLSADLKQKISAESIGRPMVIVFEGKMQVGKRGQPMKVFRVIEVLEPEAAINR